MKRYVYYLLGMNILVLGITCNTLSNLGVGAFSTLPFAISSLSALTFGQANIIFYLLFVFLQIIIERKISVKFVLEIPFSFIFGFLVDFYQYLIPSMDLNILYTNYCFIIWKYLLCNRCLFHAERRFNHDTSRWFGIKYFRSIP